MNRKWKHDKNNGCRETTTHTHTHTMELQLSLYVVEALRDEADENSEKHSDNSQTS